MVTSFPMAKDLRGTVRCPAGWPEFQPLLIELWKKTLFIHSFTQQILTVYLDSDPDRYKPHSNNRKIITIFIIIVIIIAQITANELFCYIPETSTIL